MNFFLNGSGVIAPKTGQRKLKADNYTERCLLREEFPQSKQKEKKGRDLIQQNGHGANKLLVEARAINSTSCHKETGAITADEQK